MKVGSEPIELFIKDEECIRLKLKDDEVEIAVKDVHKVTDSLYPAVSFTVESEGRRWKSKAVQLPESIMVGF